MHWRLRAACDGMDVEVFFPPFATDDPDDMEWGAARRVCGGCPVRDECLRHGLRDEFGMFGGLVPKERERLVARMRRRGEPVPRSVLPPRW